MAENEKFKCGSCSDCGVLNCIKRSGKYPDFCPTAALTEAEEKEAPIGDNYVLKVGEVQGALCHAPLQVAMEKGYLDEAGINWERVDFGNTDIQAALGAGTIDCGFGLVGKFVQPIAADEFKLSLITKEAVILTASYSLFYLRFLNL